MIDLATSTRIAAKLHELAARADRGDFVAVGLVTISATGQAEVFADTGASPLLPLAVVGGMSALSTRLEVTQIGGVQPQKVMADG